MTVNYNQINPDTLLNSLMYSSYEAQRSYGMSHEATCRIGLGTEAFREKYENVLPDIASPLKKMHISLELEKLPMKNAIQIAIHNGLQINDFKGVVKMIKEQANDNRQIMVNVLGNELLNEIENY